MPDPLAIVQQCFQAFAGGDRAALEAVIAEDLRFFSPLDNGLDRDAYLRLCWPNHETIASFDFVRLAEIGGGIVVATYEAGTTDGRRFRNTEILSVRDGRIRAVEVYFGWSLPHPAPPGGHVDQ